MCLLSGFFFFFQAEDGIRDLVRSRGLGDVYKRQVLQRVRVYFRHDEGDIRLHAEQAGFIDDDGVFRLSLIHI